MNALSLLKQGAHYTRLVKVQIFDELAKDTLEATRILYEDAKVSFVRCRMRHNRTYFYGKKEEALAELLELSKEVWWDYHIYGKCCCAIYTKVNESLFASWHTTKKADELPKENELDWKSHRKIDGLIIDHEQAQVVGDALMWLRANSPLHYEQLLKLVKSL
ncbi:hypothetical protein [Eubacterium oxidoreducens]|uniref:Uncharacterized protein n=1 Tax=Eubacterium oxidoreducens TaxID=1732 RepID=A0A1G6B4A4_EUBOX|nr:hypothetical protein [Eubacterium oxidoreducens]SDB15412.1 hypothetical protein SAMN02910417_01148 [Eubacterium oxidoreducens]